MYIIVCYPPSYSVHVDNRTFLFWVCPGLPLGNMQLVFPWGHGPVYIRPPGLLLGNMQLVFPWGHGPVYIHVQVQEICRKPLIQRGKDKRLHGYIYTTLTPPPLKLMVDEQH